MHRSRLVALVIDCKTGDLDAAARFWSGALGRDVEPADPESPTYRGLGVRPDEPLVLLQKVEHESRVHIDIESDDVDAEAARLERLGAKKLREVKTWWVMEAPSGHRFCVVHPQRGPLGEDANQWP
jgi:predicted enzyme related to lactoylglutathione lyase